MLDDNVEYAVIAYNTNLEMLVQVAAKEAEVRKKFIMTKGYDEEARSKWLYWSERRRVVQGVQDDLLAIVEMWAQHGGVSYANTSRHGYRKAIMLQRP